MVYDWYTSVRRGSNATMENKDRCVIKKCKRSPSGLLQLRSDRPSITATVLRFVSRLLRLCGTMQGEKDVYVVTGVKNISDRFFRKVAYLEIAYDQHQGCPSSRRAKKKKR